jgi:hypothetical protein
MEQYQNPEWYIQQMGPIEYFKTATTSDKGLWADEHDQENEEEGESSGIGTAWYAAKDVRCGGEKPLVQCVVVSVDYGIVDYDHAWNGGKVKFTDQYVQTSNRAKT